jgi:hypothetical protein
VCRGAIIQLCFVESGLVNNQDWNFSHSFPDGQSELKFKESEDLEPKRLDIFVIHYHRPTACIADTSISVIQIGKRLIIGFKAMAPSATPLIIVHMPRAHLFRIEKWMFYKGY